LEAYAKLRIAEPLQTAAELASLSGRTVNQIRNTNRRLMRRLANWDGLSQKRRSRSAASR
jgi:hypothetical protein